MDQTCDLASVVSRGCMWIKIWLKSLCKGLFKHYLDFEAVFNPSMLAKRGCSEQKKHLETFKSALKERIKAGMTQGNFVWRKWFSVILFAVVHLGLTVHLISPIFSNPLFTLPPFVFYYCLWGHMIEDWPLLTINLAAILLHYKLCFICYFNSYILYVRICHNFRQLNANLLML